MLGALVGVAALVASQARAQFVKVQAHDSALGWVASPDAGLSLVSGNASDLSANLDGLLADDAAPPILAPRATTTTCAPTYTDSSVTISGTGTLPKPSTFVVRDGTRLLLDGQPFSAVGPNAYWLCQDENLEPVGFTDKGRIREIMAIAVAMGGNTVRATTCGVSVGNSWSIMPRPYVFIDDDSPLWDVYDYAIYAAKQYGLRLLIPLTDNYDYYHGGKYTFLRGRGISTADYGRAFFTNARVIKDFKRYVYQILTRVNRYTGVRYADEPAILGWELGNELGGYVGREGFPPYDWVYEISYGIRAVDSRHLIFDGTSGGVYNYTTKETAPSLNVDLIDVISDHGYPRNLALLDSEKPLAQAANKPFHVGEYDWNGTGGDDVYQYLHEFENTTAYAGDMVWNVMGHDAECCAFVPHGDGYSLYYPNGNTATEQRVILKLVKHWWRLTGRGYPRTLPAVACPQPPF